MPDQVLHHRFKDVFPEYCATVIAFIQRSAPTCDVVKELLNTGADCPVPQSAAARVSVHVDPLECRLCFPFADPEMGVLYAVLFYDAQDADGFCRSFECAAQQLQAARSKHECVLQKLERADAWLLRSDKLAGIGQLAAGIAHEINNPAGYVFSNLKTLAGYVHDLLLVVDAIDTAANVEELKQLKHRLEYGYIRDDIQALIAESEEGIDRIKKIISALKDFSYVQEEGFQKVDLHHGIESTLNIAINEIKYKADVVKAYGEIPMVECNASQINQVILNLLTNSAQAMGSFGNITIRTGHEDVWVWLEVEDSGCGMEQSVIERMFEPFFTTKPMGQGTGLGLSLSSSIIEKHSGRLDVHSTPGAGSRVRVWLPIEQRHSVDVPVHPDE